MLKQKYGITMERYEEMLAEQHGGCALCRRKPASDRPLHVDQCHKTGRVRGILCHQCNWFFGTIDADPEILVRLMTYGNWESYIDLYFKPRPIDVWIP